MSLLGWLALFVVLFGLALAVCVMAACVLSSRISRDEDRWDC